MPRWLAWTGRLLAGLLVLILLLVVVVYLVSSLAIRRTYNFPDSAVKAATDSASLAWGRHLVEAVAKCQDCHEGDLGGKMMIDDAAFARLATANLTAGRGGLAAYTDADFERAIRHGVGRDGRPLIFMPSDAYGILTDEDLAAMLGYLRSFPPVDRGHPDPKVGPVARLLYLTGKLPLLPVEITRHDAPRAPRKPVVSVEYGEYLATIGGCRSCHGQRLAGDANPDAPDITGGRLAAWREVDFFRVLREGRRPDGSTLDPSKMPWVRSGLMTDDEVRAVWTYMRSLPAGAY
ncbi:MAG TPA: cytochrome c [Gemmatimonadales bacterium]